MGMASWLRKRAIAKKRKHFVRSKRFHSFDTAKQVGLVFKMEKNEVPPEVLSTYKWLHNRQVKCCLIGYYAANKLPEGFFRADSIPVFTKSELTWYGRPISDDVDDFLENKFDIVIDFCREEVYPIQYVVSTAKADLIIGGALYPDCPYDLIVDAQKTCDAEGYVEQIKHYLSTINHSQSEN